jgi:PAS domain S-box-containing protein
MAPDHSPLLQSYEAQFRLVVEGVRDYAIFMLDPDGRIVTWNQGARRIKGYEKEEIIGRHFSCFYSAEDRAVGRPAHALATARATGRFKDRGFRVRKDGRLFLAEVLITAIENPSGTLVGYSKVTRDLSEWQEAQDGLAEIQAALETEQAQLKLLSEAHHEIRGPVHVIVMATYNLERQLDALNVTDKRALEAIKRGTARLSHAIDEILDLQRVRAGAIELKREPIAPAQLIEGLIRDYKVLADQKDVTISWKNEVPNSITILFDEFCFTQMISNLLNNAIKFTEHGCVNLRLFTQAEGSIAIEVSDTGIGMDEAFVSRLFKPFARENRSGSAASGAGLGLALTQRYAQLNNAQISVKTRLGEGTTFLVTFSS